MRSSDCKTCRLVRMYLLVAAPLLVILGSQSLSRESETTIWFARVELIDVLAYGSLVALVVIIVIKAYLEFFAPRRRLQRLAKVQRELEDRSDCSP